MVWIPLGDTAWLCEWAGSRADLLALQESIRSARIPEITDLVLSYQSLAVYFEPESGEEVREALASIGCPSPADPPGPSRIVEIPTDYHHPCSELAAIARQLGMTPDEVVKRHSSPIYEVAAVGFSPGFPYLTGLDPALSLPRKGSPSRVPKGAVAIAASQAGIYPNDSMGGWHLIGHTHVPLFDPSASPPTRLRTGDQVKFIPYDSTTAPAREIGHDRITNPTITVIEPGPFSTIQDLGRPGHRAYGVIAGGASDPVLHRIVNGLVGNPANAATIECVGGGPVLRFHKSCIAAWNGWVHGSGKPHHFHAGDVLDLRDRMTSAYGYIAFQGGMDVPIIMGSRATDVRARFGGYHGRALRAGDPLVTAPALDPSPPIGSWHVGWPHFVETLEIRYLRGVQHDWFTTEAHRHFQSKMYRKSSFFDRTGLRLDGPQLDITPHRSMMSQPVVPGSIQVPPDGSPIVLLPECQTIGGYPQIGHIISADLPTLARALPGTRFRFREVTLDEARSAWMDLQKSLALMKTGLSLLP